MNWDAQRFDWNHVRAFVATAEEGSLSAAARALGQTQPTLGRQVAALEDSLGVLLFDRIGRSLSLTEAGRDLLRHASEMAAAAGAMSLAASGRSQSIEGHVIVTAGDIGAAHQLPRALARLSEIAPRLTVEIKASNAVQDLLRREADIAVRHVRPTQPDLIARRVRRDQAALYAAPAYLERYGSPPALDDLRGARFAGFEPREMFLTELAARGLHLGPENLPVTSANSLVLLELVRRGDAIGVLTRDLAALVPGARRVLPEFEAIEVETWLVSHRELISSRRIRLIFDLLAEALSRDRAV